MRGFFGALLLTLGVLAVLLGVWWICQGTGLIPVGMMAHHMQWAYRGAALVVVGVIVAFISRRI